MSDATNLETAPPVVADSPVASSSNVPADRIADEPEPRQSPAARPTPSESWATCWLSDRDVVVFTLLATVVLALSIVRWGQLSGWGGREIDIERLSPLAPAAPLDLNEATWVELGQLHGVGEALAVRIVEDRRLNGPFQSVDDLDRVKGIGPKMIEQLRPHLVVTPTSDAH